MNSISAGMWLNRTGKYAGSVWSANAACSDLAEPAGPTIVSVVPGTKAGRKNGNPWMWSRCVCVMSRCAWRGSVGLRALPSSAMPEPESMISRLLSRSRTSMHVVLPP